MSNDKQQTPVDWFGIEIGKLFAQYHGKIICIGEFHKRRFELEEQAKEMEKEQIKETASAYYHENTKLTPTQYYNETYGGGEQ
jgi:hypothetical protein